MAVRELGAGAALGASRGCNGKRGEAGWCWGGGSWGVGILDRLTFDPTTAARGIDPRTPPVHRDARSQKSHDPFFLFSN